MTLPTDPPTAPPSLLAALQPPERRGLHDMVLAQLLGAIRTGQVKQGERLVEADIAERLGLSRGVVREAIRRLEQEGLVTSQPHRGTFITQVSPRDAVEIFALRRLLESFAVRLAVPRVAESDLERLDGTVAAMVDASKRGDRVERVHLDLRFHEQVCLLSGYNHLHRIWSGLALKLWLIYFDQRSHPGPDVVGRAVSHFELIEHLRRRDLEAAVGWIESHIDVRAERAQAELAPVDDTPDVLLTR